MLDILFHWWRCPRTVESAAAEYEHNFLVPGARDRLISRDLDSLPLEFVIDHTRMIGYRYGLCRTVTAIRPTDEDWARGWNRRAIREGGGDARQVALRIL